MSEESLEPVYVKSVNTPHSTPTPKPSQKTTVRDDTINNPEYQWVMQENECDVASMHSANHHYIISHDSGYESCTSYSSSNHRNPYTYSFEPHDNRISYHRDDNRRDWRDGMSRYNDRARYSYIEPAHPETRRDPPRFTKVRQPPWFGHPYVGVTPFQIPFLHNSGMRSMFYRFLCLFFMWPIYIPYVIIKDLAGPDLFGYNDPFSTNHPPQYGYPREKRRVRKASCHSDTPRERKTQSKRSRQSKHHSRQHDRVRPS